MVDSACYTYPKFSYFANAVKTCQVTKEENLATATATLFANTSVKVTSEGSPYLNAAIGTCEFFVSHVQAVLVKNKSING